MGEPKILTAARERLARAEAIISTEEGLYQLQEGLTLLERVADENAAAHDVSLARNLARTYSAKIYGRVKQQLAAHRPVPEPELEHLFAIMRAFDDTCFDLPEDARALKVEVVRRLIDLYYEGHSAAEKQRAYEELAQISRGSAD